MAETSNLETKTPTPPELRNPTGKGGFGDRPQDINRNGTWNPKNTFSFQMSRFKNMTIKELSDWNKNTPNDVRTVAEDLAFKRVFNAQNDLPEFKEVADRTEGKAPQTIKHEGEIDMGIDKLVEKIDEILDLPDEPEENIDHQDSS